MAMTQKFLLKKNFDYSTMVLYTKNSGKGNDHNNNGWMIMATKLLSTNVEIVEMMKRIYIRFRAVRFILSPHGRISI
ncbi:hypothetical protein DERF_004582 [Dermatophagoides farinae]|uniref:Uncharacterized protein n=1 Tax=Dermatophagoides farinae TaxID=6954 RepID=A0A922L5C1_DERFA|nr:hypothetical protein DERF_004582 [Dermatophagoides farinae]